MSNRISFRKKDLDFVKKYLNLKEISNRKFETQRGSVVLARKIDGQSIMIKIASKEIPSTEHSIIPSRSAGILNETKVLKKLQGISPFSVLDLELKKDKIIFMSSFFIPGKKIFDIPKKYQLRAIIDLIRSVDKLHSLGFVHGDIQPENIIFRDNFFYSYSIALIDFELSQSIKKSSYAYPGKSEYLSPESAAEAIDSGLLKNIVGQDIYSLGVTILAILLSDKPIKFKSKNLSRKKKLEAIAKKDFSFNLKKKDKNFAELTKNLIKLLKKTEDNRPKTVIDFASELGLQINNSHTDELEEKHKNIRPIILRHDIKNIGKKNKRIREVKLIDQNGTLLTYALTFLSPRGINRGADRVDIEIKNGAFISRAFQMNGYYFKRNVIESFHLSAPKWLRGELGVGNKVAQAKIIEFCVRKNNNPIFIYGVILEVYSNDSKVCKNEIRPSVDILRSIGISDNDIWEDTPLSLSINKKAQKMMCKKIALLHNEIDNYLQ